ncbi:MAG: YraN family protein [Puniceicoccales bacterium]|jgi:Holliday junction resolvase-like predicted endonuclease|nr:YraN family protein [Puniceicoccales bacterium]
MKPKRRPFSPSALVSRARRRLRGFAAAARGFLAALRDALPVLRAASRISPKTAKMKVGVAGEDAAAKFLREQGCKIIARNWRSGRDEIDIVAKDGGTLVFVEVKTRGAGTTGGAGNGADSGTGCAPVDVFLDDDSWRGNGYYAVDRRKRDALARARRAYLRALPKDAPPAATRFDIVEVRLRENAPPQVVAHRGVPLRDPLRHVAGGTTGGTLTASRRCRR